MISRSELEEVARFKRLSLRNAERDYFLDLCLNTVSMGAHGLVFKGGTALYKFHNLNRFSEDLDFIAQKRRIDIIDLADKVGRACNLLGITSRYSEPEEHQRSVSLQMSFNGPLYDGSKMTSTRVVFDISLRERPMYVERKMYSPMSRELGSFELLILRVDELLAEKIRAVLTRSKPRDVYDCWFLLKKGVKVDADIVERKLRTYKLHFEKERFIREALRKRGQWHSDLDDMVIGALPKFEYVIKDITELV